MTKIAPDKDVLRRSRRLPDDGMVTTASYRRRVVGIDPAHVRGV